MRRALAVGGAFAAAAAAAWAGWIEPRRLVVTRRSLALPGWPRSLDGFRLGVITDIHAGVPHTGPEAIARAVEWMNREAPDLVALGGDYLDAHPLWGGRISSRVVAEELGALRARLGTIAVLGNHDWKRGGDAIWRELEAAGITVLENQAVERGGLWIAGLADMRMRRPDIEGALAAVPRGAPVILLSHDPDQFPRVPDRVALTVAGHTHGGQVAIPVIRRPAIPSYYGERYASGHVVEDGRHLYVSSGLGTSGLPLRALAPPEIVVLELCS